jgi:hypothetical protein
VDIAEVRGPTVAEVPLELHPSFSRDDDALEMAKLRCPTEGFIDGISERSHRLVMGL